MNLNETTGQDKAYAVTYIPKGERWPTTVIVHAVSGGVAARKMDGTPYERILKVEPIAWVDSDA